MYNINCDVVIVGGGPAGLAAAVSAKEEGAKKVLIIETLILPLKACNEPNKPTIP